MSNFLTLDEYKQLGFHIPSARMVLDRDNLGPLLQKMHQLQMARDAALLTEPNAGVPIEYLYFIDPRVIDILTAPHRAREIFDVRQKGSWTTSYVKWAQQEFVGDVSPYDDFSDTINSDVNYNWPERQQGVFQTPIRYGLYEQELMGEAKINYAAAKQEAAAKIIDQSWNKYAFFGIEDRGNYGMFNDPNLPAAIQPATAGAWSTKDSVGVYNDLQRLFAELSTKSNGWIDTNSNLKLLVDPTNIVYLGNNSIYNQTTAEMIQKFLPNLQIISVPELAGTGQVWLIAPEVNGQPTADIGYSIMFQASPVIQPGTTHWTQKFWASSYGTIYYQTIGIAIMENING